MTDLPITLGGNTFGWTSDREESFAVLDAFTVGGGTLVDTADMYSQWGEGLSGGESETVLGEWFAAGNRDAVKIATKVGAIQSAPGLARDVVDRNLDASLSRLQTDRIDLYYYHYDDESVPVADQVETAVALVESGRVGRMALSNYSPERMREFFRLAADGPAAPAAVQLQYSLLARAGYEKNYRPLAEEFGVAPSTPTSPWPPACSPVSTAPATTSPVPPGKRRPPGTSAGTSIRSPWWMPW